MEGGRLRPGKQFERRIGKRPSKFGWTGRRPILPPAAIAAPASPAAAPAAAADYDTKSKARAPEAAPWGVGSIVAAVVGRSRVRRTVDALRGRRPAIDGGLHGPFELIGPRIAASGGC